MSTIYKLEWEIVPVTVGGVQFYQNDDPVCKPSEVPEVYWTKVSKQTDNPWQQFNTLKKWADTGEQLIRRVRLFEAANEPQWKPVEGR